MVSSVCRESCSPTMRTKSTTRVLNIDNSKDYTTPLHVETSVEYDLPSHIYPPKGAQPILMIHPAFVDSTRPKKSPLVSYSPARSPGSSSSLPLQVYNNQVNRKASTKSHNSKVVCSCGVPNCNARVSRTNSVSKQSHQQSVLLNARKASQIHKNNVASKTNLQTLELSHQQIQAEQQKVKYRQLQHQNQLHLHQVQMQMQERKKLHHARQLEQAQLQQNGDILSWSVSGGRCMGPCCQPGIAPLPSNQAEFLAPGMPPSLVRTPTRGSSVSSPKLRARARRAINVASSINLPEYLGNTARSSRNNTSNSLIGGLGVNHSFSRSVGSSYLAAATPAPVTAHEVASAIDVVRAHVLTPQSIFASSQLQKSLPNTVNNTTVNGSSSSLLHTVGQSRDSGCSLGADLLSGSNATTAFTGDNISVNNGKWSWNAVDSGFSTPVDFIDDQTIPMDVYDSSTTLSKKFSSAPTPGVSLSGIRESTGPSCPSKCGLHWMRELGNPLVSLEMDSAKSGSIVVNPLSTSFSSSSSKDVNFGASRNANLYWMTDLATPLSSTSSISGVPNSFLPPTNPHYIPQPIWNLAY